MTVSTGRALENLNFNSEPAKTGWCPSDGPFLLSFASLVLGGPIDNRDFSHLSQATFNGFDAFLIALGLIGFITVYGLWRGYRIAHWFAIMIGWSYVVVALDLGKIFPVSPDATGFTLGLIMIIDAILALNVVLFSYKALGQL